MKAGLPVLILALALAPGAALGDEVIDGIAAQVGTDIVLVSEVTRIADPVEARMREAGTPETEISKMKADVLESLIERRLVNQVVRRAELEATDAEVDEAIGTIAASNELTIEELQASVDAHGLPYEQYREKIRGEIEHAKVLNGMVRARVRVDEDEVRRRYERRFAGQPAGGTEVHVRSILVTHEGENPSQKACTGVREARRRIVAGESFGTVAAEVSEQSPQTGGDLGWLHTDALAAWMEPVVRELEAGEMSGVLELPFGCTLLRLEERREYRPVTYEQARDDLWSQLFDERTGEEYGEWMEKLREQTYIERKGLFAEADLSDFGYEQPTPTR